MNIETKIQSIAVPLNLPAFDVQLRPDMDSLRGGAEIFDRLRNQWVALTPEEWVRQHFVNFLIIEKNFPTTLMANEVSLTFNTMWRRCDSVIYTKNLKPLCIVEYKAPGIKITQKVFDQIARYNSILNAKYLIVSNGLSHYCCKYNGKNYQFLPSIPSYDEMMI